MKKIKMFMGAVLCMNLLTLSGCDRVVQSAVVEEKDEEFNLQEEEQSKGEITTETEMDAGKKAVQYIST